MNKLFLLKMFGNLVINITDIGQYRMRLPARSENTIHVKRLEGSRTSSIPGHLSPVVKKITDLHLLPWILKFGCVGHEQEADTRSGWSGGKCGWFCSIR